MVESISGTTSGVELGAARSAQPSAPTSDPQAQASTAASEVRGISPRMTSDSVAGVLITEYLSGEGQVKMQIPSEATVAYLRSGLNESGQVIQEEAATTLSESSEEVV